MQVCSRLLVSLSAVSLCLVAALSVARATPPGKEAAALHRFAGGQWQRGELLSLRNCASCHRADLRGRCMAPSLRGVTGRLTDEAIVAHARKIGDKMCCARHIRNLSDRDFADIIAYFHAVDRNPAVRLRADRAGAGGGCCCSR